MKKSFKIGDIYGIYEIISEAPPTKDGHKRWHVRCTKCGVEKDIRPINLTATVCNHKQTIEPRFCKCCGNVIPYNSATKSADYRLREYCNSSCAARINSKRTHTKESNLKASATLLAKRHQEGLEAYEVKFSAKLEDRARSASVRNASKYYHESLVFGKDYVICPYCNLRFGQIQKSHLKLHNKTFEDLYAEFGDCYKVVSDVTYMKKVKAGRETQQKLLNAGEHKGWQSRNIISYAEQFWSQVLDNNNIEYQREVPVKHDTSNYFLDFVLERNGKLIDLEIDGKQHTYSDRMESDIIRDLYLTEQGYLVYRIAWNEISSEPGKELVSQKINDFLEFYKQFS